MRPPTGRRPPWSPPFLRYLAALGSGALGDALVFVSLPFLVLRLAERPEAVATTLLLASLPRFAGPLAGALADRLPLGRALAAAGLTRAAIFALLGAAALHGSLPLAGIFAAAVVNGFVTTFVVAAGGVAVPRLVPRAQIPRANALVQAASMGLPMLGYGVGGALVAAWGPATSVLAAVPAFLALGALAASVRIPAPASRIPSPGAVAAELAQGMRFLLGSGPLALILPLSLLLNAALVLVQAVMPVAMERAGHGAGGYGLFQLCISVGMALGIAAVAAMGGRGGPRHQITAAHGAMAVGFATMALGGLAPRLAGGAVLGFGIGFVEVAAISLLQWAVPDGLRGKVLGTVFTANALGQSLGASLAGVSLASAPAGAVFGAAAAAVAASGLLWALGSRAGRARLSELLEDGGAVGAAVD